jgi:hypothetical protein
MAAQQDRQFDAEVSIFKLHDGSSLRDLSPYITNFDGLPGEVKMNDSTTYGSTGERPTPSIYTARIVMDLLYNHVTSVGVHTVLALLHANKTLAAFEYYPVGEGTDDAKITGNAYLAIYRITGRVGSFITVHAELPVNNKVTIGVAT